MFDFLDGGKWLAAVVDLQDTLDASPVGTDGCFSIHHVGDILSREDAHDHIRKKAGIDLLLPQKTFRLRT